MNDTEELLRQEFEKYAMADPHLSKIRLMRDKLNPNEYFYAEIDEAFEDWKKENSK